MSPQPHLRRNANIPDRRPSLSARYPGSQRRWLLMLPAVVLAWLLTNQAHASDRSYAGVLPLRQAIPLPLPVDPAAHPVPARPTPPAVQPPSSTSLSGLVHRLQADSFEGRQKAAVLTVLSFTLLAVFLHRRRR